MLIFATLLAIHAGFAGECDSNCLELWQLDFEVLWSFSVRKSWRITCIYHPHMEPLRLEHLICFFSLLLSAWKGKQAVCRDARAKTWRGKIIYQPTCSRLMFWLLDRSLITPAAIQKPKKLTCNLLFNLSLSLLLLLRQSVARMNYLSFQWIIDFVSSIFSIIFTLLMFLCSTFELIFQFLKSGWIFVTESQGLTHNIRFMFASNAAIIVSDINSALLISDDFPPQIIIPKDVLTTA